MLCLKYVSEQERISIKKKIKITLDIMEILELLYENIFCPYNPGAWNLLPFSLPIFTHPPSDHEISDANVGHCTFDSFAFLHPPPPLSFSRLYISVLRYSLSLFNLRICFPSFSSLACIIQKPQTKLTTFSLANATMRQRYRRISDRV